MMERVLVLAPHTDDAEIGCGGTIARLVEQGVTVHVAALSTAEDSLPEGSPRDLLEQEFHAAMDRMGIPNECRWVYRHRVRHLPAARQDVLDVLMHLRSTIEPDTILLPSANDVHQDHQTVHLEGIRAYRGSTILGYELPRNHITFSAEWFARLEETHVAQKWAAMQEYRSQFTLSRSYFDEEYVRSLARIRGLQVGCQYAEAFEVYRVVM